MHIQRKTRSGLEVDVELDTHSGNTSYVRRRLDYDHVVERTFVILPFRPISGGPSDPTFGTYFWGPKRPQAKSAKSCNLVVFDSTSEWSTEDPREPVELTRSSSNSERFLRSRSSCLNRFAKCRIMESMMTGGSQGGSVHAETVL